jgi:hypothetical protein
LAFQWIAWQGFQRTGWPSRTEEKRYDAETRAGKRTAVVVGEAVVEVAAWTGAVVGLGTQSVSASRSDNPMSGWAAGTEADTAATEVVATDMGASTAAAEVATARAVRRKALGDM